MLQNRVCSHPHPVVDQFLVIQFPSNIVTFYCSECSATVSLIGGFNPIQSVIFIIDMDFFWPIEFNDLVQWFPYHCDFPLRKLLNYLSIRILAKSIPFTTAVMSIFNLVGGFNPPETYLSDWIIIPTIGENNNIDTGVSSPSPCKITIWIWGYTCASILHMTPFPDKTDDVILQMTIPPKRYQTISIDLYK